MLRRHAPERANMNDYVFINARVGAGLNATLYRHGAKYAITNWNTGLTHEFDTRAEAAAWREALRPKM